MSASDIKEVFSQVMFPVVLGWPGLGWLAEMMVGVCHLHQLQVRVSTRRKEALLMARCLAPFRRLNHRHHLLPASPAQPSPAAGSVKKAAGRKNRMTII